MPGMAGRHCRGATCHAAAAPVHGEGRRRTGQRTQASAKRVAAHGASVARANQDAVQKVRWETSAKNPRFRQPSLPPTASRAASVKKDAHAQGVLKCSQQVEVKQVNPLLGFCRAYLWHTWMRRRTVSEKIPRMHVAIAFHPKWPFVPLTTVNDTAENNEPQFSHVPHAHALVCAALR